jgi:hypothetical protein
MASHSASKRKAISVPMPEVLQNYWAMWNETDLDAIRGHLNQAVASNITWADPLHFYLGRDALEANVRALRMDKPEYRFVLSSEIDAHHLRYRYEWQMMRRHRVLMQGLDIVTLDAEGLIERVDGFFGRVLEIDPEQSGVPVHLRP